MGEREGMKIMRLKIVIYLTLSLLLFGCHSEEAEETIRYMGKLVSVEIDRHDSLSSGKTILRTDKAVLVLDGYGVFFIGEEVFMRCRFSRAWGRERCFVKQTEVMCR